MDFLIARILPGHVLVTRQNEERAIGVALVRPRVGKLARLQCYCVLAQQSNASRLGAVDTVTIRQGVPSMMGGWPVDTHLTLSLFRLSCKI